MEKVFENPRINQTKLGDILSANGFGYDVTATYIQRDSNEEKYKYMVMTYINDTGKFKSDNKPLMKNEVYQISIFSTKRDLDIEKDVEDLLINNKILYDKINSLYLVDDKMHQCLFEVRMPLFANVDL